MDERARALLAGRNFATVSMGRKDGSVFSVYTWIDIEGDRITLEGAQDHINQLSHKYHGYDYDGGFPGEVRIKLYVEAEHVNVHGG
jgi:hypothetical protein